MGKMKKNRVVTITFSIPPDVERAMLSMSVERMVNTTLKMVSRSRDDDAAINYQDWSELKAPVAHIWADIADRIRGEILLSDYTKGTVEDPYILPVLGQY